MNCKFVLSLALVIATPVSASSYHVIHRFQGGADGINPGNLVADAAGNLYGTTGYGGSGPCSSPTSYPGCGIIFQLRPPAQPAGTWTETVLYSFQGGSDGRYPAPSLVLDHAGNLYGTTTQGGGCTPVASGCGVVFRLSPPAASVGSWTYTVLYIFQGGRDGLGPAGLIAGHDGSLVAGYAPSGGVGCVPVGCGLVFRLHPSTSGWTKSVLYFFRGVPFGQQTGDGSSPNGLSLDQSGALFGTTSWGGFCQGEAGCYGTAFRLVSSPQGSAYTVLYRFSSGADTPASSPVFDAAGNLYGTSGTSVYQLSPCGNTWTLSILHDINSAADGTFPYGGVTFDSAGHLWGTATGGGLFGDGLVFELTPPLAGTGPWDETVIHNFAGATDGIAPDARLLPGAGGRFFGTTLRGGNTLCVAFAGSAIGCGTVFAVAQ